MSSVKISEFAVIGLHGRLNVRVPIKDNKLVLIGVNGLGKSTFINIMYYFLSLQWRRLLEYQFSSISTKIGGRRFNISRDELEHFYMSSYSFIGGRKYSDALMSKLDVLRALDEFPQFISSQRPVPKRTLESISRKINVSPSLLLRIRNDIVHQRNLFEEEDQASPISDMVAFLKNKMTEQILFLPTYRRIEKDLETIFPELQEEITQYNERRYRIERESPKSYVELVQFGMEDVEKVTRRILVSLRETARTELNNLAGKYLRDVIREEATEFDVKLIRDLDDNSINKILDRVEERTLIEEDKDRLRDVIERIIQHGEKGISEADKYIAHFFTQLFIINSNLSEREEPVKKYVETCNAYFADKIIEYDEINYNIELYDKYEVQNQEPLQLSMLSSGEKQIVSLFSHIFLSDYSKYIIIIDEPELSLSVDWQERLLPDIVNSGKCSFLAAVTHSPFIFDNELDQFAVDMTECVERVT